MAKNILYVLFAIFLTGCAGQLNNDWLNSLIDSDKQAADFDFSWQLVGDASLLPLQVFDNGKKTWLQYSYGTVIPAMFAHTDKGDVLLRPVKDGEFLVINTVPTKILLRGGLHSAEIYKSNNHLATVDGSIKQSVETISIKSVLEETKPEEIASVATNTVKNTAVAKVANAFNLPVDSYAVKADTSNNKLLKDRINILPKEYSVSPKDLNIRRALKLWSKNSEWTFSDEHWSVDVDIPISGSASFGNSFQVAVRDLLAATELGDRPLQPCFYSNKVLRIVPLAQRCDRTAKIGVSL